MVIVDTSSLPPSPDDFEDLLDEICRHAAVVFYERGFEAPSMSELVGENRFFRTGLYYYLKSKRRLLFSVLFRALKLCDRKAAEPARAEADPSRRLVRLLRGYLEVCRRDFESVSLVFTTTDPLEDDHRERVLERREVLLEVFETSVEPVLDPARGLSPAAAARGMLDTVHEALRSDRGEDSLATIDASRGILLQAVQSLRLSPAVLDDVIDLFP